MKPDCFQSYKPKHKNMEKNGLSPVEAYKRDVGLWKERLERQKLEIEGHLQRQLSELVDDYEEINRSGAFKISMYDPAFTELLKRMGLRPDESVHTKPKKVKRTSVEIKKEFDDFISMLKPGEPLKRADFIATCGKRISFDRIAGSMVKQGKLKKVSAGTYQIL
jgi:hypothetical protein